MRKKSPFTSYFNKQLQDEEELSHAETEPDDDVPADNELYCVGAFNEILSVMHLFPLWSAAMQKDTHVDHDGTATVTLQCRSNTTVENYFKLVKHGCFKEGRVSPRMFVLTQSKFINVHDITEVSDNEPSLDLYAELSSDEIESYQRLLRTNFPEAHRLQTVSSGF